MIRITVHTHPGARSQTVHLLPDGSLDVKLRAPALDGRANAALVLALAHSLGLRPRQVRLLRGERSREKLVELDLPNRDELRRRLSAGAEVLEGKADQRTEPAEKGRREYLVAGERTRIRQFNRFDVARWLAWPDHPDPIYSPYNPLRMSGSMAAAWYDDLVQRQAQQPYAVDDLTGTMIGRIFLRFVNRTEGSSVLGIDFDPRYVGQGYGLDSLSAFLTYYFGRLGFRRLLLSVAAYNLRARRSYERCGFVYLTSHWERFNCEANVLGDDRYSELRKYFRRGRAGLEALFHTMVAEKSD